MSVTVASFILAGLFALGGLFSIAAGIAGWEWFFSSANVKVLTGKLHRSYARLLYIVLGLAILAMALYLVNSTLSAI